MFIFSIIAVTINNFYFTFIQISHFQKMKTYNVSSLSLFTSEFWKALKIQSPLINNMRSYNCSFKKYISRIPCIKQIQSKKNKLNIFFRNRYIPFIIIDSSLNCQSKSKNFNIPSKMNFNSSILDLELVYKASVFSYRIFTFFEKINKTLQI